MKDKSTRQDAAHQRRISRREAFRKFGRLAGLGGLAAITGTLGVRSINAKGVDRDKETCINDYACRGCSRVDSCYLPQAVSHRQLKERIRRHG